MIEVMIVVAIIGILAAVAFPSYREYIQRGRRAEAQAALMEAAQFMQRFYAANNSYNRTVGNANVALPDSLKRSPRDPSAAESYTIGFAANEPTPTTFRLEAVPKTGSPMDGDRCGTFSLTHTGVKRVSGGAAVKDCWK